jgi:hypothetical protein
MKKIKYPKYKPSEVQKLRNEYLKKGIELVNISTLCSFKLGTSGSCNSFDEPDESIHHIQVWYRDKNIGVINGGYAYAIEDDKYLIYVIKAKWKDDLDFIVFKLCKRCKE